MLLDHTKKIAFISLSLVLMGSLTAVGQQYNLSGQQIPGPGPAQMQPLPGQSVPGQAAAYTPYRGYQSPQAGYQASQPYMPSQIRVAQLPNSTGTETAEANPFAPSLPPQQPAAAPSPAPQAPPSDTFQPKPSQPVTIRPKAIAPVVEESTNEPKAPFPAPQRTIMRKLENASEKMEMVVNTSRILTLDNPIPQAQVNNPEILTLTPLSPNQIQLSAKKPGVTQVNIWSDDGHIYSIDVLVVGDAEELRVILQTQFPSSALKIVPVGLGGEGSGSVYISGYVDRPENVTQITQIAEQYYPKVINNVTVSGVQQVLLHAKVMEVSRTKLRTLGIDWAQISGNNLIASGVSGLLGTVTSGEIEPSWDTNPNTGVATRMYTVTPPSVTTTGDPTFQFSVVDTDNAFFGILEALREDQLAKVLAEPTLVTVNGQPASFLVGGEVPVPVPQSLGTISIEYKKYGTQLNFVPLVLGDGRIRMEVKPRVSELDRSTALFMDGYYIYGFRSREVKTSVEMNAGQTLAIAGLINERTESERRGLPWVSDVPVLGAFFRRVTEKNNEIEMLVFVTPELVDAMDPDEVPPGGPGMNSCRPTDCQLYWKGHLETDCSSDCGGCRQCYGTSNGCVEGEVIQNCATNAAYPSREVGMRNQQPMRRVQLEPTQAAAPSQSETDRNVTRQNRYTPQNQVREASRASLPGFQGRLGY